MLILGISAYSKDSAACLLRNDEVLTCTKEELFTQEPQDSSFPFNAISYCLKQNSMRMSDIGAVVYYEKPVLKLKRDLETCFNAAPFGFDTFSQIVPKILKRKLWKTDFINRELNYHGDVYFSTHHHSLAAAAFYTSPFKEAAILVADSMGEWTSNSLAVGKTNRLAIFKDLSYPHSIGALYEILAKIIGLKGSKLQRHISYMASLGDAKYLNMIKENLIDLNPDGSYHLNNAFFSYLLGKIEPKNKLIELLGIKKLKKDTQPSQEHYDLAASIQSLVEECLLLQTQFIKQQTNVNNLCLAGNFAENPRILGKIQSSGLFKKIWIQPGAGIAGAALGAGLCYYYGYNTNQRSASSFNTVSRSFSYGPKYDSTQIELSLIKQSANYIRLDQNRMQEIVAEYLVQNKIIACFNGALEFGDNSTGSRCVLANATNIEVSNKLKTIAKANNDVEIFTGVVLADDLSRYTSQDVSELNAVVNVPLQENLFKSALLVAEEKTVSAASQIPVVTQDDASVNIKAITESDNTFLYNLLKVFKRKTGFSVLASLGLNNDLGLPVRTPAEAYSIFMKLPFDVLLVGDFLLLKSSQAQQSVPKDNLKVASR